MEEKIEREAAGLTGDEDFGLDDLEIDEGLVSGARRKDGATSDSDESDYTATSASAGAATEEDLGPAPAPDTGVMDELLGDDDENLDLDDLDDLADDLENMADELDDDEDLDTSFLDEML